VTDHDPDVAHCEICGTQLTPQEMLDSLETDGPVLCSVHAAEVLPEIDEPPPTA
jgi:hypothetical protein